MKRGRPPRRKKPLRAKKELRGGKPLRSKKAMARGAGPTRKKRIGPGSSEKRAKRFREQYESSDFVQWVHGFPCAACGVTGWTEAAHVRRRSQGGKARGNIVPLCGNRVIGTEAVKGCHAKFDQYELEDLRLRLGSLAKEMWREWEAKQERESER